MTQAAAVQKLVGEFGAAAKPKLAAGGQPEDQLRGPLENLMQGLADLAGLPKGAVVLTGEKSLAELRTRPDYAVEVANALTGFIEVKAPGKGADPRALGGRSILGCPSAPGVADRINEQIKFRERWRPFCPSMLDRVGPQMHLLMAASFMATVPVLLVFFFAQRLFIQGIVFTGLKG